VVFQTATDETLMEQGTKGKLRRGEETAIGTTTFRLK
jgi:hypothetical protein